MTRAKAVSLRKGRFRPHLEPARPDDPALFAAALGAWHAADWRGRARNLARLGRILARRGRWQG
jgi:hypothetical protein